MADNDQRVVFLERDVAEELLDLVDDRPGDADEDLLDQAVEAIQGAGDGLPGEAQQAVARGDGVAVGLDPAEAATITTLILENTETDPGVLRSVSSNMKAKLKAAAKKAKRRKKAA
ncbi:MAG TPA: hypothetical protein VFU14_09610 [Acidimicrobiales bacterium]|nr:hypothetical protein [Acidimicrobiales bacterium]